MDPSVRVHQSYDGTRPFLAGEIGHETFIDRKMEFIYGEEPQKLFLGRKIFRPRYQAPIAGAPRSTDTWRMNDVPDIVSPSVDINVDVNKNVVSKLEGSMYRETKSDATDNREIRTVQSGNAPQVSMRTSQSAHDSEVTMRTTRSAESPDISRRISQSMAPEMSTRTIQSMNTPKIKMVDRSSRYGAVDVGAERVKTGEEEKHSVFGIETGQSLSMPPPPTVPDIVADTRQVAVDSVIRVHSGPHGSEAILDGGRAVQGGTDGMESVVDGGRVVYGGGAGIDVDTVVQCGTIGKEQYLDRREETLPGVQPQQAQTGRSQMFQVRPMAFSSNTSSMYDPSSVQNTAQTGSYTQIQGHPSATRTPEGAGLSNHEQTSQDEEPTMRAKRTPPKPRPRSSKILVDASSASVGPQSTTAEVNITGEEKGPAPTPSPRTAENENLFDLPPPPKGQEYNTLDISHMLVLPKLPPLEQSKGRPRSLLVERSRNEVPDTQVPSKMVAARPVSASYPYNPVSSVRGPIVPDRTEDLAPKRHDVGQERQEMSLERSYVTQERKQMTPMRADLTLERADVTLARPEIAQTRPDVAQGNRQMTVGGRAATLERTDVTQFRQDLTQARPDLTLERQTLTLARQGVSSERVDMTQARQDVTQERQNIVLATQDVSQPRPETTFARTEDKVEAATESSTNMAMSRTMEAPPTVALPSASTFGKVEQTAPETTLTAEEEVEPLVRQSAKMKPAVMKKPFGMTSSGPMAWAPVRYTKVEQNNETSKTAEAPAAVVNTPPEIKQTKIGSSAVVTKTIEGPPIAAKPLATNQPEYREPEIEVAKSFAVKQIPAKPLSPFKPPRQKILTEPKGESQVKAQTVSEVYRPAVDDVAFKVPGVGDEENTTFVDRTMETVDVIPADRICIGRGVMFSYDGTKSIASVSGYENVNTPPATPAPRAAGPSSEASGQVLRAPGHISQIVQIEEPRSLSLAQGQIEKKSITITPESPPPYLPEARGSETVYGDVQTAKSQELPVQSFQSIPQDISYKPVQDVQIDVVKRDATTFKADESSVLKSTDPSMQSEIQLTSNATPSVQSVQSVQNFPPVKPVKPPTLSKPTRLSSDLTDVDENKPKPKPKPKPMLFGAKPFSATPRSVTSVKVPRPGQAWTGYSQQTNTDAKTLSITKDIIGSSRFPAGGQTTAVPGNEDNEYRSVDISSSVKTRDVNVAPTREMETSPTGETRPAEVNTTNTESWIQHKGETPEPEVKTRTVPVQSVKPFSVESRTLSSVTAPSQQPRQDVKIGHITEGMGMTVNDKTSYVDPNSSATISAHASSTTSSRTQIGGVVSPGALDDEIDAVKVENQAVMGQNTVSQSGGSQVLNTTDIIGSARYPGGKAAPRVEDAGYRSVDTNIRSVETTDEVVLRNKGPGSESTAREVTRTSSITGSRPLSFQPRKRSSYVISAAKKKTTPDEPAPNTTQRVSQTLVDTVPNSTRRWSQTSIEDQQGNEPRGTPTLVYSSQTTAPSWSGEASVEHSQSGVRTSFSTSERSKLMQSGDRVTVTAPAMGVTTGGYATADVVPADNGGTSVVQHRVEQEKYTDQIAGRFAGGDPQVIESGQSTHITFTSGPSVSATAYSTTTQGGETGQRYQETRSMPMSSRDIIGLARYPGGRRSPRDEDVGYTRVETGNEDSGYTSMGTSVSNVDMDTRTVETTDEAVLRNPREAAFSAQREVTRTSSITGSRPPSFQARKRSSYVISAAKKTSVTDDTPPSVAPKPVSTTVSESRTIVANSQVVSTEASSLVQDRHTTLAGSALSTNDSYYNERSVTGVSVSSRSTMEHSPTSYNEQSIDRKMDTVDATPPRVLQVRGEMSYVPYPTGDEGDRLSVVVTDL